MKPAEIAVLRLRNQQVLQSTVHSPAALVHHMGAMQAQDFAMSRWAVGIRMKGCTDRDVLDGIDSGKIIRTHVMRPTWHLVAAEDVRWMISLTAPGICSQMGGRHKALGLTAGVLEKSRRLLYDALKGGHALTRKEIAALYTEAGIPNTDNRLAHLLMMAELDGLICSGPSKGRDTTYALLDERVPAYPMPDMEESLQRLALTYFYQSRSCHPGRLYLVVGITCRQSTAGPGTEQAEHDTAHRGGAGILDVSTNPG